MLTMRKIRGNELKRFKKLEGEYHYMGETRSAGDTLRLVAEEDGGAKRAAQGNRRRTPDRCVRCGHGGYRVR